jgi:hypothetical protein
MPGRRVSWTIQWEVLLKCLCAVGLAKQERLDALLPPWRVRVAFSRHQSDRDVSIAALTPKTSRPSVGDFHSNAFNL